jgi:hypothetical protein
MFERGNPYKYTDPTGHQAYPTQGGFGYGYGNPYGPGIPISYPSIDIYIPLNIPGTGYDQPLIDADLAKGSGYKTSVEFDLTTDEWHDAKDIFPSMDRAKYRERNGKYEIIQDHTNEKDPHYNKRVFDKNDVDRHNDWLKGGKNGPQPTTPQDELGPRHPDHKIDPGRVRTNVKVIHIKLKLPDHVIKMLNDLSKRSSPKKSY